MLGYDNWPETGEIDIMEYVGEKDWASAAVHGQGYSGETPFVNRLYFGKNNDVTHWHVYAVDWTPDRRYQAANGRVELKARRAWMGDW